MHMRLSLSFLSLLFLFLGVALAHGHVDAVVKEGVDAFAAQCHRQQTLLPELIIAIKNRDLSRAINAYVAARPPYEQIETLANAFPDIDAAIDARPYSYHTGEDDPYFQGFHYIERALYRDQRLNWKLEQMVLKLNMSVNHLCDTLQDMDRFNPYVQFAGSIALAFEVPAKKVASEEETWSDLSLMIFRNNYQGIWSQVDPYLHASMVSPQTNKAAHDAYKAIKKVLNDIDPKNKFATPSGDARAYSSVSVFQRKRIVDAAYVFATVLETVRDEVFANLPKGPDEKDEEDEEGEDDVDNAMYEVQVKEGLQYFHRECVKQQQLVKRLTFVIGLSNVQRARHVYEMARLPYEQIEVLAGDFADLDGYIDQRPYSLERGELDDGWRGFHQVERALFRDNDLGTAKAAMGPLAEAVDELCDRLEEGVNGGGSFSAGRSFDGMITLAYEVGAKKISSEEETWSDLSVMIFRENLKGIWSQFSPFMNRLPKYRAMKVKEAYEDIKTLIKYTVDAKNDFESGTKFVKYSDVAVWGRKAFSDKFYTLARALVMAKASLKKN